MQIVFQNSGGLDSLVAAKLLYDQGHELHSVFIDMGQPSAGRATISAQNIADRFCAKHEIITMRSNIRDGFATNNMLTNETAVATIPMRIPFGSTTTTTIATMVALNENIPYVASGTRGSMRTGVSQSTQRENLRRMFADPSANEVGVTISHPLDGLNFLGVVSKAYQIGLTIEDLSATVSCNLTAPCGTCIKCQERTSQGITIN